MGFGVAIALLLDATIVRSVLVPASMKLLGERNWYFPTWLNWLPDVHVEGHSQKDGDPQPAAGKPPEGPDSKPQSSPFRCRRHDRPTELHEGGRDGH